MAPAPASRRQSSSVTFKGGLDRPFHRWFRLTPSYSPELVHDWISEHPPTPGLPLLDPFLGAGTTCISAASLGVSSIGFEINPFLAFVARTSCDWSIPARRLVALRDDVLAMCADWLANGPLDAEAFASSIGTQLPIIHNVFRWWRPDVLRELVAIRHAIAACGQEGDQHLRLALAQIVYPTASITLGRLQIAFKDRSNDDIDAIELWTEAVSLMADDLEARVPDSVGDTWVVHGDSRMLDLPTDMAIGGVFCSPPYPNRYSYVWNTRPHLYLLELIDTPRAATEIDLETIGGTWGTATTRLQKGEIDPLPRVSDALGDVLYRLATHSLLMRNYVCKYFNDLDAHLEVLVPRLAADAAVGYVVGNTETNGIMVDTQHVLADLLNMHGLHHVGIEPLRTRNSGEGLIEATVFGNA